MEDREAVRTPSSTMAVVAASDMEVVTAATSTTTTKAMNRETIMLSHETVAAAEVAFRSALLLSRSNTATIVAAAATAVVDKVTPVLATARAAAIRRLRRRSQRARKSHKHLVRRGGRGGRHSRDEGSRRRDSTYYRYNVKFTLSQSPEEEMNDGPYCCLSGEAMNGGDSDDSYDYWSDGEQAVPAATAMSKITNDYWSDRGQAVPAATTMSKMTNAQDMTRPLSEYVSERAHIADASFAFGANFHQGEEQDFHAQWPRQCRRNGTPGLCGDVATSLCAIAAATTTMATAGS